MTANTRKNPWLGLESYQEGEILYGRDDDIRDLIQCVLNDVDTLLYGKSGIGKSSLLNAGILPAARRNGYLPIIIRLSHKGDAGYLAQIKSSIMASMELSDASKAEISGRIKEIVACKNPQRETLYEYLHRHTFHDKEGNRIKLLLIFDQFEEIFTLQSDETKKRKFFAEMADVLNDIMPSELQEIAVQHTGEKEVVTADEGNDDNIFDDLDFDIASDRPEYVNDNDIHFVFTIREDFLSEFEYYTSGIPSLKQNRYGLRPIDDEQASQIILRPEPGLISKSVAKLIIEKVTGRSDFELDGVPEIEVDSAVLSLYLNRLYEAKNSDTITADLVEEKGGEIISDFYNEAIADISQSSIEYLEDMLLNGQGRRDNITVFDALHEGGVTAEELNTLCNKNKILRQFNYAGVLRIEYIHDILCPIVAERKEKRKEANRIRSIEDAARAEKIKAKRRLRLALSTIVILLVGFGGFLLFNWYYHSDPVKKYYIAYGLQNGWPVGIGPELTESQRKSLPLYYELSHPGHAKRPYNSVRVCSTNSTIEGQPVIIPMLLTEVIPTDSVPTIINDLRAKIRNIAFNPTADSKDNAENPVLDNMAFYDADGNLLFTFKYVLDSKNSKWYTFNDASGHAMMINDRYIDRINVATDSLGYVNSAIYYDANGVKRPLWGDVYGYTQSETLRDSSFYNEIAGLTFTTLDQFGQPTNNVANTIRLAYNDDNVTISYYHKNNNADTPVKVLNPYGYAKVVRTDSQYDYYGIGTAAPLATMKVERDSRGNIVKMSLNDKSGKLAAIPAVTTITYDALGHVTSKEMLDGNNEPFSPGHAVYKYVFEYTDDNVLCRHEEISDTGRVYFFERVKMSDKVIAESRGGFDRKNSTYIPFHTRIDSCPDANTTISLYYDSEHRPINFYNDEDDMSYHKVLANVNDSVQEYSFFQIKDGDIVPMQDEGSYFRLYSTYDKEGNILTCRTFDKDGNIMNSMQYFYANGHCTGRAVLGIFGTPVRCDEWDEDGFMYYTMYFNRDFAGEYTDFMTVNEFAQPSLLFENNLGYFSIRYGDMQGAKLGFVDAGVKPIVNLEITKHYWQYYPERAKNVASRTMTYAHLLNNDNLLYTCGLKDGDIIFACGTWRVGQDTAQLATQLTHNTNLTIYRPLDGKYERRVITLPRPLTSADLASVHFHNMKLSTSEKSPI